MKKKKRFKKFSEFTDTSLTDHYPPPIYVVEPAKDDKGFFMFKKAFDKRKRIFSPGYFST